MRLLSQGIAPQDDAAPTAADPGVGRVEIGLRRHHVDAGLAQGKGDVGAAVGIAAGFGSLRWPSMRDGGNAYKLTRYDGDGPV